MAALDSPGALWRRLQSDAGLELRRKGGARGRDADLADALKVSLGFPADGRSLEQCLDADHKLPSPCVTTEAFVVALLTSQQGYAAMMHDLLDLLADANATRDAHTLDIEFRFDSVSEPIRKTLEQFRDSVERIERVLVSRYELPKSDALWALAQTLRQLANYNGLNATTSEFPTAAPQTVTSGHRILDEVFVSAPTLD